jgi:hypothetical protein
MPPYDPPPDASCTPGWKSSEFWLTALSLLSVVFLIAIGRMTVEDVIRLWPMFAAAGAYSISRGVAKKRPAS